MIVLGIDPGTRRVGYGLIQKIGGETKLLDAGILNISSPDNFGALLEMKTGLSSLFDKYSPDILAIEKLFFVNNQKTGIQVAEFRGAALLCSLERGLLVQEYSPSEIKMGVAGYGSADKKSVLKMVRLILKEPMLDVIDDASDALAVAILAADRTKYV